MSDAVHKIAPSEAGGPAWERYLGIARVDHWVKNAFMLLGVILAIFYEPSVVSWASLWPLSIAVLATCLVASSNYVLNELLDGQTVSLALKPTSAAQEAIWVSRSESVSVP